MGYRSSGSPLNLARFEPNWKPPATNNSLPSLTKQPSRQANLEVRFPLVFESVDSAVDKRNAKRKDLNADPDFQARNRAVVDAGKAIKDYEQKAAPDLIQLAADAKRYSDSHKSSEAK